MKLRTRGRKAATRCVTDNDAPLEAQNAQAMAADTWFNSLGHLSKIESILSILLGQDSDGSGTESPSQPDIIIILL